MNRYILSQDGRCPNNLDRPGHTCWHTRPHDYLSKDNECLLHKCISIVVPANPAAPTAIRTFDTGATRDQDVTKYDYEGFLSPLVIERYGKFMHLHRHQADGTLRDSDNWQKGIPRAVYIKSAFRHFLEWWRLHRHGAVLGPGYVNGLLEDAICALIFNAHGYLHEMLRERLQKAMVPGQTVSLERP